MRSFLSPPTIALIAVAGMLAPMPAFAQPVPRPDDDVSCSFGNSGNVIVLPDGTQLGINIPDTLNCGAGSLAGAQGATAIGDDARATGVNSTALGSDATATGANSTALGSGARATHSGATAVGSGAVSTLPNQVTLGGPGSSVRIGDIAASTSAQVGPVGLVTIDSAGTLGVDMNIIPTLRRDAQAGTAAAMAIGYAPMPSAPGRTSYSFNLATFRGERAVGGSIMHRLGTSTPFALTAGFSFAGHGNNGGRVGIAGEF